MATYERREAADGSVTYRVKVRLKGFPVQSATFKRKTDAKRWAEATETAIREGRYFKSSEAKKRTIGEAIERYIATVLPTKPKSQRDQSLQLRWWQQQIGAYFLSDATPALLIEQRDKLTAEITPRKQKRSPATVNRYIAALSHVFTIASKEWGWLEQNPFSQVRKLREPRGRTRYLSDEERERLLAVCKASSNDALYLIVVLALSSGARKMEILNLKWQDVELAQSRIVLHETKNKETRVIVLSSHVKTLFTEYAKVRQLNSNYVFPNKNNDGSIDIRKPWEIALQVAGIENFRFHDLRHSAASYLAMNGATPSEIAGVLGHKTLQMVKRYAHLSESHLAGVVERMNSSIFGS
jgi:integrase